MVLIRTLSQTTNSDVTFSQAIEIAVWIPLLLGGTSGILAAALIAFVAKWGAP